MRHDCRYGGPSIPHQLYAIPQIWPAHGPSLHSMLLAPGLPSLCRQRAAQLLSGPSGSLPSSSTSTLQRLNTNNQNSRAQGVLGMAWSTHDPTLLLSTAKDNRTICWDVHSTDPLCELPSGGQHWNFDVQVGGAVGVVVQARLASWRASG